MPRYPFDLLSDVTRGSRIKGLASCSVKRLEHVFDSLSSFVRQNYGREYDDDE
jgi:hypothetical protein